MAKSKKESGSTAVLEPPAPKKVAEKPAEPEKKQISTTELAAQLGTKPTILRRWLRTLPRFQDNGYTRYKWDEDDQFLSDAKASFEKYQKQSEEKKEARLAEARDKSEKKAKKKSEAKAEAEEEPDGDELESDEIDEEETEELE